MPKSNLKILASYFLVYVIWSTTLFSIKVSVKSYPTFLFVGLRWLFSGMVMLAIVIFMKRKKTFSGLTKNQILNSAIIGFFLLILSNGLLSESEKYVDSYFASLIITTVPVVMVIFDYFLNKVKVSKAIIPSLLLGMVGIALLVNDSRNPDGTLDYHVIMLLVNVLAWSYGSALSHKKDLPENSILNSALQSLSSGVIGLIIYLGQSLVIPQSPVIISLDSMIALAYLVVFGSIGMIAYVYLIKHEPLSRVSTYSFVNAIGSVIIGVLIGGEILTKNFYLAFPMILVAVILMLRSRVKVPHMESEAEK